LTPLPRRAVDGLYRPAMLHCPALSMQIVPRQLLGETPSCATVTAVARLSAVGIEHSGEDGRDAAALERSEHIHRRRGSGVKGGGADVPSTASRCVA